MKNDLSDRERIWLRLATDAARMVPLGGGLPGDEPVFRFANKGEPVAGQVVLAVTSSARGPHPHVFGECVGRADPGPEHAERDVPLIRAFGDPPEKAIFFFNEMFYIYTRPTDGPEFLEGWKRDYYLRLTRALPKAGDTWRYRFAGLKFGDGVATLTVRPHIFFQGDQPFDIELPAGPKTLQRDLIAALKTGGFGTRWEKTA